MQIVAVSKIEQVRQAILLQVLKGELRPGQRLLEAKLAAELNVSQATVNAALQDLHNQSIVTKQLNRSTTVCRYTRAEIENLFRVRLALEPLATELLSEKWSAEANQALREHVDQMRRAARMREFSKFCLADYLFHQDLYKLTGNSFLIQACQAIAAAPFAYILCGHLDWLPTDYLPHAEEHQDVIDALQEGPQSAGRITRERIQQWLDYSMLALTDESATMANLSGDGSSKGQNR